MVGDLCHELDSLRVGRVVDTPLENTASVSVGGDLDAVGGDGVVDELHEGQNASHHVRR